MAATALCGAVSAVPAKADTTSAQISAIEKQIHALEGQLSHMKRDLSARNEEVVAARREASEAVRRSREMEDRQALAGYAPMGPATAGSLKTPPGLLPHSSYSDFRPASYANEEVYVGGVRIGFPKGRPTISSADDRYSFSVGLAFHYDIGGFVDSQPTGNESKGRFPGFTENARRLRIPFTFRYDNWSAVVTPDFGSSVDGTDGLYEANLNYSGFKNTVLTAGYFQPRVTLEDAESSNDFELMERPAITEIVRNIAAGDARFSVGGLHYNDRFWIAGYFTGQTFGNRTADNTISDSQTGGVLRIAGRPIATKDVDMHLGVSLMSAFKVNEGSNGRSYTFSERPETRLTTETLLNTGRIGNVDQIWAAGPEFALRYRRLELQSEYYHIGVQRSQQQVGTTAPVPNLGFEGYYVEANYTLLGHPRAYSPKLGAFTAPVPEHDFDPKHDYWGAWEVTGRWSAVDLDDGIKTAALSQTSVGGIRGGYQRDWEIGVNWYPNKHFRTMLDFNRFIVSRSQGAGAINTLGRSGSAVTGRIQANF